MGSKRLEGDLKRVRTSVTLDHHTKKDGSEECERYTDSLDVIIDGE